MNSLTANRNEVEFTTFKMDTANLPAALKALVKLTGKRPKQVDVHVTTGPTVIHQGYATNVVVSLGQLVKQENAGYVGSDGESNHVTDLTYSAPVAYVYGFGKHKRVNVVVGNVSEGLVLSLQKNKNEADGMQPVFQHALLAVATDQALES